MALADPIFTLDEGVQLFWTAFGMPVTVVPLKVALGLKNIFGHSKKIITQVPVNYQLLMVPLSLADHKLPKTIETPHLKLILSKLEPFV